MLNLDTEDWGEIFIGCAGGGDSQLQLDVPMEEIGGHLATRSSQFTVWYSGQSKHPLLLLALGVSQVFGDS